MPPDGGKIEGSRPRLFRSSSRRPPSQTGIQSSHEGSAHASWVAAFRLKCCYRASLGPCGIHKRNEVAIALLLAVFLRRRQCYLNRGRLSWYGRRMGSAVLAAANPGWSRNLRVGRGSRESRSLIGHSSPLLVALQNVVNGGGSAAVMPSNTRKGFTLRIAFRNGAPFALRDFGHLSPGLLCTGYGAPAGHPRLMQIRV